MEIDMKKQIKELENRSLSELNLIGENILILPFEKTEIKGFIIPDKSKEKSTIAKVIKVGNGIVADKEIKMIVNEGDIIIFNEWSAKKLGHVDDKLSYIKQSDIIAFIKSI